MATEKSWPGQSEVIVSATGLRNRGVKEGNLHMLRETNMPAVLVELGFLSNREEEALLRSSDFHIKCGRAIAEGIENYFRQVKVIRELQSIDVQYKSLNLEGYLIEGKAFVELRAFAEALITGVLGQPEQNCSVMTEKIIICSQQANFMPL